MSSGYLVHLVALSAIWGSSYLFVKVGIEELAPTTMVSLSLLVSGALLLALVVSQDGLWRAIEEARALGHRAIVAGLLNAVLPFCLIAWGEHHIDSGVAAIASSTAPIFVALLAIRLRPSERATGMRLAGLALGLVGVGVLAGARPDADWWALLGTLAVVGASFASACGQLYAQARLEGPRPLVVGCASTLAGAALILPLGLAQAPGELPSLKVVGAGAGLGALGLGIGAVLLYRMLATYGAGRTSFVTYLLPPFALFYGVVLLDETLTWGACLGLVLILAGVALGARSSGGSPEPSAAVHFEKIRSI